MRIDAIVSPSGEVIKLTDEEQVDLLVGFAYSIFRSVFFKAPNAPPIPNPPPFAKPAEAFGMLLAAYIAANLGDLRTTKKESDSEQPIRH